MQLPHIETPWQRHVFASVRDRMVHPGEIALSAMYRHLHAAEILGHGRHMQLHDVWNRLLDKALLSTPVADSLLTTILRRSIGSSPRCVIMRAMRPKQIIDMRDTHDRAPCPITTMYARINVTRTLMLMTSVAAPTRQKHPTIWCSDTVLRHRTGLCPATIDNRWLRHACRPVRQTHCWATCNTRARTSKPIVA